MFITVEARGLGPRIALESYGRKEREGRKIRSPGAMERGRENIYVIHRGSSKILNFYLVEKKGEVLMKKKKKQARKQKVRGKYEREKREWERPDKR